MSPTQPPSVGAAVGTRQWERQHEDGPPWWSTLNVVSTPFHPRFEPILDLNEYIFVFAQKGGGMMPLLWMDSRVNPYSVAGALRLIAEQIEIAADEEGIYTDADRKAGRGYTSEVLRTRTRTR